MSLCKNLGVLFAVVFVSVLVFSGPSYSKDAPPAGPKLVVEPESFDFGSIDEGVKPKAVFKIKNTGGSDLIIYDVKPSCGCTVANLSSKLVKPGESATLEAVYNSKNASGTVHKYINLSTNDPDSQNVSLKIMGNVKAQPGAEIQLNQYNIPDLKLPAGMSAVRTVQISNTGQLDLDIDELTMTAGIAASLAELEVGPGQTVKPGIVLKPGETRVMKVTVSPKSEKGRFQEVITIRSNAKRRPILRFIAQGVIQE